MESQAAKFIVFIVLALVFSTSVWLLLSRQAPPQFCGGIMGKPCPFGYSCQYDGSYPDASGTCVHLLDSTVSRIKSVLNLGTQL